MAELSDEIEENAKGPLKVTGDSGSTEQHPLPDQIAADKYLRSKQAAKSGLGIRHVKIVPPGAE